MTLLASLLPKVLVFAVMAAIGAVVASVAVAALQDRSPVSTAGVAPEYMLVSAPDTPEGEGVPVAFDTVPGDAPEVLPTLPPADLALAADSLLGAQPASYVNPSGFPRIPPITQFDGGPFQGANCTLTSGAMLARLGYGIVTTGSFLRTQQDDQDGGTDLNDLATALWRGFGISYPRGLIRPDSLKELLASGYGAVVQGDYSKIPRALRLQKDFLGGHAIYLDGYYPGNPKRGIPEAYYVIDPIGRPHSGYEGDWWPASVVDDFATAFGGGRVPAMWAYPPGGVPPAVSNPDVLPIPQGGGGPSGTPKPGETPVPGSTATPPPPELVPLEPGDVAPLTPAGDTPVGGGVVVGDVVAIPQLTVCLASPPPPGCPGGIEAVFDLPIGPIVAFPVGPTVSVVFVDSDRPNVAIVGFTVDPPATGTVKYWEADGSPATIRTPSAMSSITLLGKTVLLARLDVLAGTTYRFQAVAGGGLLAGSSPIGEFTTGNGVEQFEVTLSTVSSPVIELGSGLSPYLRLAPDAYALPMVRLDSLGGGSCLSSADFGGTAYCTDIGDVASPPDVCHRANVSYALSGIDADGVLVRAFPVEEGVTPEGDVTLDGVLEAEGPVPSGELSVGCLASGLTYHVALDAVGDDRGNLAVETVTVP